MDYEDLILQRQELQEIWEDAPEIDPKYYGGAGVVIPVSLLEYEEDINEHLLR